MSSAHPLFAPSAHLTDTVLAHVKASLNSASPDLGTLGELDRLRPALNGLIGAESKDPADVLGVYQSVISPTVLSCNHPGFVSFIPGAPSRAARAFDAIVSVDSLHAVSWLEASGAVEAENQVLALIASLVGLPESAGGTFVSGGSAGNLAALAVARDEGARRTGRPGHELRVLVSEQVHSSVVTTAKLLGITLVVVPVAGTRMNADDIRAVIAGDSDPTSLIAVVATGGTTNTGTIDDLVGIGAIASEHGLWFHVDAAYGGGLLFSERNRELLAGIEAVDSVVIDPHKWMFSTFDCGLVLYRNPALAALTHAQEEGYLDSIHTGAPGEWNPSDYAYHLTRRPRGLPLWFSLAVNGTRAFGDAVDRGIELATYAAALIEAAPELTLTVPSQLSVVVFERADWAPEDYERWSGLLLAEGIAFVCPSKHDGRTVARLAILHPELQAAVLDRIIDLAATLPSA